MRPTYTTCHNLLLDIGLSEDAQRLLAESSQTQAGGSNAAEVVGNTDASMADGWMDEGVGTGEDPGQGVDEIFDTVVRDVFET